MSWKPDITIVGAGGMGALFGAILQDGGLNVTLIDNNQAHVEAIHNNGLHISGFGGERTIRIPATTDAASIETADVILFQCKSHASRSAAHAVKHLTDRGAVAISFQNGLGNEAVLGDVLGERSVLGGLTSMAGHMTGPGRIRDFSRTPSYIGEMQGVHKAMSPLTAELMASSNVVPYHPSAESMYQSKGLR